MAPGTIIRNELAIEEDEEDDEEEEGDAVDLNVRAITFLTSFMAFLFSKSLPKIPSWSLSSLSKSCCVFARALRTSGVGARVVTCTGVTLALESGRLNHSLSLVWLVVQQSALL